MLLFGLFVLGLPFGIPGQSELRPGFAMACVFFWSLYRPSSLPAPVIALCGLLQDFMGLTPLGIWAVLLLLLHGITRAARRRLIPKSFLFTWAVFMGLEAGLSCLGWLGESALNLQALPLAPLVAQTTVAAALYPALAAFFIRAHRGAAAVELA
jgi:rod shape-determining protein MreD